MALEDHLHPYVGLYLDGPEWLKASAGRAYAWLPPRLRFGAAYDRFLGEAQPRRDAETTQRLARRKLDATLRWALRTVPAYQRFRGLLDEHRDPRQILTRLPVTGKLDIKHHPERYLSQEMEPGSSLEMHTGGSTAHPMRFYLEKHVSRPKEHAFLQSFRDRVEMDEGELVLALRGRTVASAAEGGPVWAIEPIKRHLVFSTDHLERRFMPQYAEALERHRPQWIEAFPSALYPLARWLRDNPMPQFTRQVRGVMLFSENVYGFQMRLFREVFGCPILSHYGHSERVLMAATLPGDDRYHFWPQYGWFELLDDEDNPITEPGRMGHVVGTAYDNRVMPFVRYRTGDLAVLAEGPGTLAGFPVCERIEGRVQEFVVCRDDRLISLTTLGVAHFPELACVDAIQYEQREAGRLVLKVVGESPLTEEARAQIARAVERKTQGGCTVEVVPVERIERTPRGKAQLLLQHLDIAPYFGAPVDA